MPYIVTSTNGTAIATVPDNTVNSTTTSLTLVGKNYAGYGSFLNENYIKLLENFNNSTAPSAPLVGQLWFDSFNALLKVWNGSLWKQIHTSAASNTAPATPITGDLWWDTTNSQFKVWSGSSWVLIGPGAGGGSSTSTSSGTTGALVDTIVDTGTLSHVVVKLSIANTVIAIISRDATFTPLVPITGFSTIIPGINLISSGSLTGSQFTGTATNALAINNISSTSFLTNATDQTLAHQLTVNKLKVGSDLLLDPSASTEVQIYSNGNLGSGTGKDLNLYVNKSGVQTKVLSASASSGSILPGVNGVTELGSASQLFANVWATTLHGQAITASYADLAERFEADVPMLPGTVVALGGLKEITAAQEALTEDVFGVISTNAAFLMNGLAGNNLTHPPVAVQGRVPVRVVGRVKKGDRLVSAGAGLARAASKSEITAFNVIGRSLEDKYSIDEGMVEAIVKLNS